MQTIIVVRYVDDYILFEAPTFKVQVAGYKSSTPMALEVWQIDCTTKREAIEMRERIKQSKRIMTDQKLRTLKPRKIA